MSFFDDDRVKEFNVRDLKELQLGSSSKGNQRKWYAVDSDLFVKEQFYYQDVYWRDDLVEIISFTLAKQMGLADVVLKQDGCVIVDAGKRTFGVFSRNFCSDNFQFVSIRRLLTLYKEEFPLSVPHYEKYEFLLSFLNKITGLDFTLYLQAMVILDYLVGNEDRHLNNFGVLTDGVTVKMAPLFDFGLGLFEHDKKYQNLPFRKCLELMECKPFSADNQEIVDYVVKNGLSFTLPEILDLSGCMIPSPKVGSYLLNRCEKLDISVIGVD